MKRKLQLSTAERRRIERKFECIRLSEKYVKDYNLQEVNKKQYSRYSERLDHHLYRQWFLFPLLKPNISIDMYKKKKGKSYSLWLEEKLGGLILVDSRCPKRIKVNSRSLKGYIEWKQRGFKTIVRSKIGKVEKISFPKGDKIYALLNRKKIAQELRRVKITIDLLGFTDDEINAQVTELLKELKPLAKRYLIEKEVESIRPSAIETYLETYREIKQGKTPRQIAEEKYAEELNNANSDKKVNMILSRIENQERTYKDHKRNAVALVEKGWWYKI